MLGKLIKYDLKWIYKVVIVFYILATVFSVIARMCFSIENSMLFNILGKIASGVAISMVVNSIINTVMRSWARFVKNIYKDESYLTHTLPIKKNTIYLSKVLSSLISIFTSVVVSVICLFICYYSKENMEVLKKVLELAATTYNTTVVNMLLAVAFIFFLEIMFMTLIGYTGIIIGHRFNKAKMVKTLVIAFALYMLMSVVSLGIIYIVALFSDSMMSIFTSMTVTDINIIKQLLYIATGIYLVYNVIYYYIGRWQLNKGVNVD